MSKKYYIFLMVFLGMLSAFGPFVTDMYLPTLPSMAEIFDTTPALVQMGLATSMMGLAVGQVFFGPLSDKYGRRPVLISSMVLFCVATVVSIYSPTIDFFNLCRFLQGLGGAGGLVLSRSVSTDCFTGRDLAKTMAIVGAINGIAPVTAPVVGGLVADAVGWQGIFWILFAFGAVILGLCLIFHESVAKEKRHKGSVLSLMKNFPALLRMKIYVRYVLMYSFCTGVLFAYIASASFIVQDHFGFSQLGFSLIFAVNALGIGIGSGLALKFKSMMRAAGFGTCVVAICAALQLAVISLGYESFYSYEALTFVMLLGVGYVLTSATTLAMDAGRAYIGSASAIFGASGFMFGGIVSPLVGLGNILFTSSCIIMICAAGSGLFALLSARSSSVADNSRAAHAE